MFRIVLAEKHRAPKKKIVEALGIYNPRTKEFGVKEDRLKYWISQRVELSATVHNLLVTKNLVTAPKVKAWSPKKRQAAPTSEAVGAPTQVGETPAPVTEPKVDNPV